MAIVYSHNVSISSFHFILQFTDYHYLYNFRFRHKLNIIDCEIVSEFTGIM